MPRDVSCFEFLRVWALTVLLNNEHDKISPDDDKARLYYDGHCPPCAREIRHLRGRVEDVVLIDIHSLQRIDTAKRRDLLKTLHLFKPDGTVVTGLDANVYLWRQANCSRLVTLFDSPVIHNFASLLYRAWASVRFRVMYGRGPARPVQR